MTDVMLALGLPALIVARSGLGTINHTLLTIEALRQRRVPVAGVVMVGEPNPENRAAIERFLDALPRNHAERVQKTELRADGVTADTWDREAHGYKVAR